MELPLFAIKLLRGLLEVVLLALLGRAAVSLMAGAGREQNPIYRLFVLLTEPVLRVLRHFVPRLVADRHLPMLGFFLLLWLWLVLAWLKWRLLA